MTGSGAEVISLGCRLNIAESERISAMLGDEPDIVVINSCAVTAEAVRHTRQAIRKARKERPDARLLVTGCAADIERDQIAAMHEVDGLVPNAQKLKPARYQVSTDTGWDLPRISSVDVEVMPRSAPGRTAPGEHTRAFVAVQNGCDHACTFCVIPQGRGPSRSLSVDEVLREVEAHLLQGAPEVVLTGVDVTSWGTDLPGNLSLGQLAGQVLATFPELKRLRMSSLDGVEVDEHLFDLFANEARMMPHIHLSLQHGADLILKRMKRRHSRADAMELVARLKQVRPEIAVGADIIAGFPTEDDAHHADNLAIIREMPVVHGHIFPYSPRPGTPAALMPQHSKALVRDRARQLRETVSQTREAWLGSLIGTPLTVLAESDGTGYAENFARVEVPEGTRPGQIVSVTPTALEEGLLR